MITASDILIPLATAVVIDNHVRSPELSAFAQHAAELINLFNLPPMTEAELRDWFAKETPAIQDKLNSPRRNTFVLRILSVFERDIHVENIYDAMVQISISDAEYKREESDLIKSAASLWGYNRPPLKVVD